MGGGYHLIPLDDVGVHNSGCGAASMDNKIVVMEGIVLARQACGKIKGKAGESKIHRLLCRHAVGIDKVDAGDLGYVMKHVRKCVERQFQRCKIVLPGRRGTRGWDQPCRVVVVFESRYSPKDVCHEERVLVRQMLLQDMKFDELIPVTDCVIRLVMAAVIELGGEVVIPPAEADGFMASKLRDKETVVVVLSKDVDIALYPALFDGTMLIPDGKSGTRWRAITLRSKLAAMSTTLARASGSDDRQDCLKTLQSPDFEAYLQQLLHGFLLCHIASGHDYMTTKKSNGTYTQSSGCGFGRKKAQLMVRSLYDLLRASYDDVTATTVPIAWEWVSAQLRDAGHTALCARVERAYQAFLNHPADVVIGADGKSSVVTYSGDPDSCPVPPVVPSLDGSVPLHTYYGCCSGCPVVMGWSWPDRDHEKYKEADYGGNLGEFPSIRYDKIIEYEAACGDAGDYDPLPKIMDKASFRALDLSVMRHGFIDLLPDDKHPYHCQHPDAWLRVMFSRVSQVCRQLSRRNASAPNVLFFFAHPGIDTPQCPAARIREGRSRHRMPLQELAVLRSFCRPSSQHIVRGRGKPGNVQPPLPPPRHAT